jgi:hypothetical protein
LANIVSPIGSPRASNGISIACRNVQRAGGSLYDISTCHHWPASVAPIGRPVAHDVRQHQDLRLLGQQILLITGHSIGSEQLGEAHLGVGTAALVAQHQHAVAVQRIDQLRRLRGRCPVQVAASTSAPRTGVSGRMSSR